jgi:hypothetical protein
LSLEQKARVIGRLVPWTCLLRNRLLAGAIVGDGQRESCGGRRRQNMTTDHEREVLAPILDRARAGGILVVGQGMAELEAGLGRPMVLSSVYNLPHRLEWRKLAADKRHPQCDPLAQEDWEINSASDLPSSCRSGPRKPRSSCCSRTRRALAASTTCVAAGHPSLCARCAGPC